MNKINELFKLIAEDGMKHIILSAVITVILNLILPIWIAGLISLSIGIGKEYYDKHTNKGQCQTKDLLCDLFGILIGIL